MAYPPSRSAIDELNQGMIDGTYRLIVRDRGGVIDPATAAARKDLNDIWYGRHEVAVKELPDALPARTPYFVPNPPANPPYC
jgi:hypothetical protein